MQASRAVLGGGRQFLYPKQVWSPAGGWWNMHPENWQRNTMLAFVAMGVGAVAVFRLSSSLERRPSPPIRPIPSQSWSKHAAEDDPRLQKA